MFATGCYSHNQTYLKIRDGNSFMNGGHMPIPDEKPLGAAKPSNSPPSTPVYDPGDEWFEDSILKALEKYNRTHSQPAQ